MITTDSLCLRLEYDDGYISIGPIPSNRIVYTPRQGYCRAFVECQGRTGRWAPPDNDYSFVRANIPLAIHDDYWRQICSFFGIGEIDKIEITYGVASGATCTRCKTHNEYAAPSNSYVCFECRS